MKAFVSPVSAHILSGSKRNRLNVGVPGSTCRAVGQQKHHDFRDVGRPATEPSSPTGPVWALSVWDTTKIKKNNNIPKGTSNFRVPSYGRLNFRSANCRTAWPGLIELLPFFPNATESRLNRNRRAEPRAGRAFLVFLLGVPGAVREIEVL